MKKEKIYTFEMKIKVEGNEGREEIKKNIFTKF